MSLVIHNLRAGFATNSSSSHSVILIPDHMVGTLEDTYAPVDGRYGQNDFQLVSNEHKLRYLAAQLFTNAIAMNPDRQEAFIALFEPHVPNIRTLVEEAGERENMWSDALYVDHDSAFLVPENGPTLGYTRALMKMMMSNKVVVTGGSGETQFDYPEAQIDSTFKLLKDGYRTRVRQDGPYTTIFDINTGNKVRISEDDAPPYTKAEIPELVDLKITDYCGQGCNFCYQSSTTAGKHAPLSAIKQAVKTLKALEVFEVAIGGGEPTDHPEFAQILKMFKKEELVVNFTTLSDRWLSDKNLVQTVAQCTSAIGVSCSSTKGLELVERIDAAINPGSRKRVRIMAQHVVGAQPLWVTSEFLTAAFEKKIPVLLLGYKEVGFGKNFTRHDTGQDVPFFLRMATKSVPSASLSVDTALLDHYPDIPKVLNAPLALTTSPEGKFSCYIDAVTGRMAASSYVEPETMEPFQADPKAFKAAFARY